VRATGVSTSYYYFLIQSEHQFKSNLGNISLLSVSFLLIYFVSLFPCTEFKQHTLAAAEIELQINLSIKMKVILSASTMPWGFENFLKEFERSILISV